MSSTHVSKQVTLTCALSLSIVCEIGYHTAYYKSIIKSLYTFIQLYIYTIIQLPLFTFTLNSGDTWSFYLSKVFLRNIKSTCMTWLFLNCFLSWIRVSSNRKMFIVFFLSSMLMYLNLLSFCGDPSLRMLD